MGRTIEERIKDVFPDDEAGRSIAKDFLGEIHENWKDAEKAARRNLLLVLLLGTIFELLNRSAVSEVSLAFVKVTDLPIIHKVIPVVMAFLVYETGGLAFMISLYHNSYNELMEKVYPKAYNNDLEVILHPANSVYTRDRSLFYYSSGLQRRVFEMISTAWQAVVVFVPVLVCSATVIAMLSRYGLDDPWAVASGVISTVLLLFAIAANIKAASN